MILVCRVLVLVLACGAVICPGPAGAAPLPAYQAAGQQSPLAGDGDLMRAVDAVRALKQGGRATGPQAVRSKRGNPGRVLILGGAEAFPM